MPSEVGAVKSLPDGDAVIETSGLTRRFKGNRGAFDVNLTVHRGEVFGFLGPNGAGKSTTIRLLMGLHRPDSGHVKVFGVDPDSVEAHRRIGYLPGEVSLFPRLTGRQILGRFAAIRRTTDHRYRDELVERFNAQLDRPVRNLSKGNVQKIGIVLAFAHRPELLILDEPTSGLDPLMQDEFTRLLRETANEGRTVFLSSHDLDEVEHLADRLAIIKDGHIIVTDTVKHLRSSAPHVVEFYFEQPVDPAPFDRLDGVQVRSTDATAVKLSVTGPMAPMLRLAADLNPIDVIAHPLALEELFLGYYRTGPNDEDLS